MSDERSWDAGWVTAPGGAMDRVVVFCAGLLGLCSAVMLGVTIVREVWVGAGFWALLLVTCVVVGWRMLRRIRHLSRRSSS